MLSREIIANILSYKIRNEPVPYIPGIDVQSLMDEAQAHDVSALVYHGIKSQVDVSAYKKEVILRSLIQSRYTKEALLLMDELQSIGIELVLLKGMILKQCYPIKDARTMGDVDILVKEHQLDEIDKYLRKKGYENKSPLDDKHYVYKGLGLQIEVHWSIGHVKRQQSLKEFEENLWLHIQPYEINQKVYFTLSDEDFLIHLIIHMASHMRYTGFGIRQLCDITLWTEQHPDLDWDYICIWLKKLRLMVFSQQLFFICYRLLGLKIPDKIVVKMIDEEMVNQFINFLFISGVHGKRDVDLRVGRSLSYGQRNKSFFQMILTISFPSLEELSTYYMYARRHPILLPIAWIHRLGRTMIRSDYQLVDKFKILLFSPKEVRKQINLLKWLELIE